LAKRLKAFVRLRDHFLYLRRCEVRECFDLLASRRVYSCKSRLIHLGSFTIAYFFDRYTSCSRHFSFVEASRIEQRGRRKRRSSHSLLFSDRKPSSAAT